MKVQEFLIHHGVDRNPFAEEDADSDHVFKSHCIHETHHPDWDKIYGHPGEPSTSVIFGEKGSGKSALRLQMSMSMKRFNQEHPDQRVFVIEYNNMNPFLDRFTERAGLKRRNEEKMLGQWRLEDHIDAILSIGVTDLADRVLQARRKKTNLAESERIDPKRLSRLTKSDRRDLLLLAALFDQSPTLPPKARWNRLCRYIGYYTFLKQWDLYLGLLVMVLSIAGMIYWKGMESLLTPWPWLGAVVGWLPYLWRLLKCARKAWLVERAMRVVNHQVDALRHIFLKLGHGGLQNQPLPSRGPGAVGYQFIEKFQSVLKKLGFEGVVVLMDRVDEPHILGGSADRMRSIVWPILDNKFLSHPGLGVKLLLPIELTPFIEREDRTFYEKSRLDKHNLIRSLEWSGQALYDIACDRLNACRVATANGDRLSLRGLFSDDVSEFDLISALGELRVPRHLFKFLHRLIVEHCTRHTGDHPEWKFSPESFRSCHSLYLRDLQTFDSGLGTV